MDNWLEISLWYVLRFDFDEVREHWKKSFKWKLNKWRHNREKNA